MQKVCRAIRRVIRRGALRIFALCWADVFETGARAASVTKSLWEDNLTQFARVIEEAQAAGAFTPEVMETMCDSMDLEEGELEELLERARIAWEEAKATV